MSKLLLNCTPPSESLDNFNKPADLNKRNAGFNLLSITIYNSLLLSRYLQTQPLGKVNNSQAVSSPFTTMSGMSENSWTQLLNFSENSCSSCSSCSLFLQEQDARCSAHWVIRILWTISAVFTMKHISPWLLCLTLGVTLLVVPAHCCFSLAPPVCWALLAGLQEQQTSSRGQKTSLMTDTAAGRLARSGGNKVPTYAVDPVYPAPQWYVLPKILKQNKF